MKKAEAIKRFFGATRPVTLKELKELRAASPAEYEKLAADCAIALGAKLD